MAEVGQSDTKKEILEALETYHGIVTDACGKVGLARSTFYEWLKNDPEFKAAVEEIQDTALDFVESKLFQKINGVTIQTFNSKGLPEIYDQPPSDTAIIFYLKTRGKKRGYIERTELTGADGGPVEMAAIQINIIKPNEQL